MNEAERKQYNQNYFEKVLKPKRQAAAAEKKKQKAAQREAQEMEIARAASLRAIEESKEYSTSEALALAKLRAVERQQRAACIAGEFPDLAPDELIEETGESYHAWLFGQVSEYLTDTKIALSNHDFAAFYNALSMEPAGQALLRYANVEPLAGASWHNYAYVNRSGNGVVKTLVNPPANIEEIKAQWEERWAKQGELA